MKNKMKLSKNYSTIKLKLVMYLPGEVKTTLGKFPSPSVTFTPKQGLSLFPLANAILEYLSVPAISQIKTRTTPKIAFFLSGFFIFILRLACFNSKMWFDWQRERERETHRLTRRSLGEVRGEADHVTDMEIVAIFDLFMVNLDRFWGCWSNGYSRFDPKLNKQTPKHCSWYMLLLG